MSDEMKRFLQEELKKEADQILQEVEADLEVADLKASEEIDERLYEQIRQYKEKQDAPEEVLSEQQQEWIRLGKIYQSKRKNRKYVVLATAMMAAFTVGITSFGEPERIFEKFNWNIGNREQTNFDSDDEDIVAAKVSEEEEAYQKIKDEFGFEPVRMLYLPERMKFEDIIIYKEMQNIQMIYMDGNNSKRTLRYQVTTNYRDASNALDIEDSLIKEERLEVNKVFIDIKYYKLKEWTGERINAMFEYQDIYYLLSTNDMKEEEFEKILKNLKFF